MRSAEALSKCHWLAGLWSPCSLGWLRPPPPWLCYLDCPRGGSNCTAVNKQPPRATKAAIDFLTSNRAVVVCQIWLFLLVLGFRKALWPFPIKNYSGLITSNINNSLISSINSLTLFSFLFFLFLNILGEMLYYFKTTPTSQSVPVMWIISHNKTYIYIVKVQWKSTAKIFRERVFQTICILQRAESFDSR